MEKISFKVNKDITEHPHFHMRFLKLVVEFEESKKIICSNCKHSLFYHVKSGGNSYCRICYEKGIDCKSLNKYFKKPSQRIGVKDGD